jgi:hypothetical protein
MSEVIKLAHVASNKVNTLYVFIGSVALGRDIGGLQRSLTSESPDPMFSDFLSEKELADIKSGELEAVLVNEEIHPDDTIETVKRKFLKAARGQIFAFQTLYLFARQQEKLDPTSVFQNLTQNGKLDLTKDRLVQFLLNIEDADVSGLPSKDVYDYDDVLALGLSRKEFLVSKPIGQRFVAVEKSLPYTVNPYDVIKYDPFLERYASDLTTTTNGSLVMDSGRIYGNVIFVCTAADVLQNAAEQGLSEESTVKIYFPFLLDRDIRSLADLQSKREELTRSSDEMINNPGWNRMVQNVNLFYDLYQTRTSNFDVATRGIKSVKLTIHPDFQFNLPLDVVFKLIHATKTVPLIKLNPGKRQEKAYRLYADRISTSGQRIPYLSRASVFRLMKTIGKTKKVSAYCEHLMPSNDLVPIIVDFEGNGDISITADFPKPLPISELDSVLTAVTAPVINEVSSYLSQSGYTMKGFKSIRDPSIEVHSMNYAMVLPIKKTLSLQSYLPCLSSIFSVVSSDTIEGAVLRFKRVSNYNEMDSQEAFIVETLNQGSRDIEIIQGLMSNFGLSQEAARDKLASFVTGLQVVQNAFQSKKLKIRNNPGFLTKIKREKFSTNISIEVDGINGVGYLDTIPMYLDSLIRITQAPSSSKVPSKTVTDLCKKRPAVAEEAVVDKVAAAEKPNAERGQMDIQANELVFDIPEPEEQEMQDAMMGVLMGFDDEEDEDDEEEEEDDGDMAGGSDGEQEDVRRDITGMRLSNPNPIFTRLHEREPVLFLKENEKGFKSYSRLCPSSAKRQPIILTQEEKNKIDKDHAGSYEHAIEYKSGPDAETFYYICPRYWSLKDSVSLTEEQAKSGKYGGIIEHGDRKVKPGKAIIEFNTKYQQGSDGEYAGSHPGFLKTSKHPDGLCIPCCFSQWDAGDQKARRESCERGDVGEAEAPKKKAAAATEIYVKGIDKFPLETGRYGYLPIAVQRFLNTDNKACQISATNTNLRRDHPCLLRIGSEPSRSQSFIGALAAIYEDIAGKLLTIPEMKDVLLGALDIDLFMTLQNGNLVEIFDPDIDVDLERYKGSKIYKSTDVDDTSQMAFFRKVARSYENFEAFLLDEDILISYQYLWDLISGPNDKLFDGGLNLAILELKDDDVTDNVSVICPTNHYAASFYDVNKRTAIILKIGDYYEPIFSLEDKGDVFAVTRRFSTKYKDILPNLKEALEVIKKSMQDRCAPLPSQPDVYTFKRNIPLDRLVYLLKLKGYTINKQVLNYNGRAIGLVVSSPKAGEGYVPCYPSSPMIDLTAGYTWLDQFKGRNYEDTRDFLAKTHKLLGGRVPCAPMLKMKEDGLIVGVLTETNQFVPVSEATVDTFQDGLKSVDGYNYAVVDKESITSYSVDEDRVKYIRRIKLESSFFNVFRNTVRILLGRHSHHRLRAEIEGILKDKAIPYYSKLKLVDTKLRELTQRDLVFSVYKEDALDGVVELTGCMEEDTCKRRPYCVSTDGVCKLAIPKFNLITGKDNEATYYGRMADELIRYNRIKSFVFQPKAFLAFSEVKYNLREDEIIMLQSLLTRAYFDDLVPAPINMFTKYNTYDTAEPLITQAYSSSVDAVERVEDEKCGKPTVSKLGGKWKAVFPTGMMELAFPDEPPKCTFDLILTLVRYHDPDNAGISKNELKEVLYDEYAKLYTDQGSRLMGLLVLEGKVNTAKQVLAGQLSLGSMIMSEDYYATNLDVWLLAKRFNIPLVIVSSTSLVENKRPLMVLNSDGSGNFFFVRAPGVKPGVAPKYRLLVSGEGSAKISLQEVAMGLQQDVRDQTPESDLVAFLETYQAKNKKVAKPRRLQVVKSVTKTGRKIKLKE